VDDPLHVKYSAKSGAPKVAFVSDIIKAAKGAPEKIEAGIRHRGMIKYGLVEEHLINAFLGACQSALHRYSPHSSRRSILLASEELQD
jgi:hypothetical protein